MKREDFLFDNNALIDLIVPLVLETMLSVAIGMADTVMVASVGDHAVSGVSLVDTVSNLFIYIFSAFATGGAVVISQYLGRKDRDAACFAAKQLMYLSAVFSIAISLILMVLRYSVLDWIYGSLEESVRLSATSYFLPILLSFPFLAILNNCNAVFRSMGKSKITFYVSLIMNIVNIVGNALFIFVFHLDAFGVGLASLLSRIVACSFMFYRVTRSTEEVYVKSPLEFSISISTMIRLLRIAIPSSIENSVFHIGRIIIASTVATLGTASIAANAVIGSIGTFVNVPGSAIGLAAVTVIGQCCGASDYIQAKYYAKKLVIWTYFLLGVTCLSLFVFCPNVIGLYGLSDVATDIALKLTRLHVIQHLLFWPPGFLIANYLRAAGDVRFTMLVTFGSMWLLRIFLSRFLGIYMGLGLLGVYLGMYSDWWLRSVIFPVRFLRGKWMTKKVI